MDKYSAKVLLIPVMIATAFFMLLQGVNATHLIHRLCVAIGRPEAIVTLQKYSLGINLGTFATARTLCYFVAGCLQPMLQKLLSQNAPANHRGIAFGLSSTAMSLGGVMAVSSGAWLMIHYGVDGVFLGVAALTLLSTPLFYLGVTKATQK